MASVTASPAGTPIEAPPGGQDTDSSKLLAELAGPREQTDQQQKREDETAQPSQPEEPRQEPQHSREQRPAQNKKHTRRWSENPVGTPIFMARKFAEKLRRSKEGGPTPSAIQEEATPSTSHRSQAPTQRRKSSASSQSHPRKQTVLPKIPAASSKQASPAVQKQQVRSPSTTSRESIGQAESAHSTSSKKRGKRKRKSRTPTDQEG